MFRNSNSKETRTEQPDMKLVKSPSTGDAKVGSNGTTQVAQGAEMSGEFKTAGSVTVDGKISGQLNARGDVQVGRTGVVEAEVEGKNVTVAGQVKGRIYAEGNVVLLSGSRVEGDIHAQSLKIEDNVFFQGGCVMGESARRKGEDTSSLPESVTKLKAA